MDARDQLGQRERLGDVVVAADGQTRQLVLQRVAGSQEEDGDPNPVGPQAPGDLEPVEVRQHHVEDDEVRGIVLGLRQRLTPGGRLVHREPFVPQRRGHCVDDGGLVVHYQNSWSVLSFHGRTSLFTGSHPEFSPKCGPPVGPL